MNLIKILIVDDDADLCNELAEFFKEEGFHVLSTSDEFEGENLIDSHEFDVALLDYKMPGLTGIDLLRKIRNKGLTSRVFIVTGKPFIEDQLREEKMAHLVDGVIKKPIDVEFLLEKIRHGNPA